MNRPLEGKTCLIAGVGEGVGRASAHLFWRAGAAVTIVARRRETLEETASLIEREDGKVEVIPADLSVAQEAARVVSLTLSRFGSLDALFCCAGMFEAGSILETHAETLEQLLSSNLRAQFHTAKAAATVMKERGHGAIVLTSAVFGPVAPTRKLAGYAAAKGAILTAGLAMAADLRDDGIRVNVLCPGQVTHHYVPDRVPGKERKLGIGPAYPEEIARAALFLCSDAASWITGATLTIDGGFAVARNAW